MGDRAYIGCQLNASPLNEARERCPPPRAQSSADIVDIRCQYLGDEENFSYLKSLMRSNALIKSSCWQQRCDSVRKVRSLNPKCHRSFGHVILKLSVFYRDAHVLLYKSKWRVIIREFSCVRKRTLIVLLTHEILLQLLFNFAPFLIS